MLLTAIYNMLKKNEPYNPELYRKARVCASQMDWADFQANPHLYWTHRGPVRNVFRLSDTRLPNGTRG